MGSFDGGDGTGGDDDGIDNDGTWGDRDKTSLALVPVAVTGALLTCTSATEEKMGVVTEFTEAVVPVCELATLGCCIPALGCGCGVPVN